MRVRIPRLVAAIRGCLERRPRTGGQSFAEFALILPVFLLVILIGLDFGRAFMGYVSLQQTTRIAANFASLNPTAWIDPGSTGLRQRYKDLVFNDAQGINCDMPSSGQLPNPTFPGGTADGTPATYVGKPAVVTITCRFHLLTPIISLILPNPLPLTASSSFPIRKGAVAGITGTGPKPVVQFSCLPSSGTVPLNVSCSDFTINNPTAWTWDFGDGSPVSHDQNPYDPGCSCGHQYTAVGTYIVTLTATNLNGTSLPVSHTITVNPPNPGPIAEFTWSPTTGLTAPQIVNFTDTSQNSPNQWSWNFGDGSALVTTQNPSHTFSTANTFTITLTATSPYGTSQTNHQITVDAPALTCLVPDFKGTWANTTALSNAWIAPQPPDGRQFTGPITYSSGGPTPATQFIVGKGWKSGDPPYQTPSPGSHPLCSVGLQINIWSYH